MINKDDLPKQDFVLNDVLASLKCEYRTLYLLCKDLDQRGEGELIIGRRGWPTRFAWKKDEHLTPVKGTPVRVEEPSLEEEPIHKPTPIYKPSYVSPPLPKKPTPEVSLYEPGYPADNSTPGRAKLNEVCEKLGLNWGMIKFSTLRNDDGKLQTTAMILIGKMQTTEEQEDIDHCLGSLADTLQQQEKN